MGNTFTQQERISLWVAGLFFEVLCFGPIYYGLYIGKRVRRVIYWSRVFEEDDVCGLSFADALNQKLPTSEFSGRRYQDAAKVCGDNKVLDLRTKQELMIAIDGSRYH